MRCGDRAQPLWGGKRLPSCLEYLVRYGKHAKEVLPELREIRTNPGLLGGSTALLDKAIADIETLTDSPALVDLKQSLSHPKTVDP